MQEEHWNLLEHEIDLEAFYQFWKRYFYEICFRILLLIASIATNFIETMRNKAPSSIVSKIAMWDVSNVIFVLEND